MINEILQNLINTREVASFIDYIIMKTGKEKEYDKIVKKVVKRLAENDSYVKAEKYKQKVIKVGFLEVVIGPEGVKIDEARIKEILDWPTLKEVKDIQKFLGLVNYY